MAGRNSRTLPGSGILGGVTISTDDANSGAPETEFESPWGRALREAVERHTGVSASSLRL